MSTSAHMFAHVPAGKPSLRAAYQAWLEKQTPPIPFAAAARPTNVGIIGGGMAGLYSALLLKAYGVSCTVFEAHPTRLGGRVYTHRFNSQPNQYFEAGAMRLPNTPEQQPVFELIDYLNGCVTPDKQVNLIPYTLYDTTGNLTYVNGTLAKDGSTMTVNYANTHTDELGFPVAPAMQGVTASKMLADAIAPFAQLLQEDFEKGFEEILKFDNMSFFTYLTLVLGWSIDEVNYVETMESATNQFQNSFTELIIESLDFSGAAWKTIENGMDRLPLACAEVIGSNNIQMGYAAQSIENTSTGRVTINFSNQPSQTFDKVLMAIPPAALRMIKTPQWSAPKTQAIRTMHYEPLYKIGMRFKTRFWEQVPRASKGGQSVSDLRTRWCVYPSYGIGTHGEGVLLLYSWMTDAYNWLPMSEEDRIRIGLEDLQTLYQGTVDIQSQFLEAFSVAWPIKWATGDAMFYPGQFSELFNVAQAPEGNVYFAGEHLSVHHTWIVGAIDSALLACQQMLSNTELTPLSSAKANRPAPHGYDYSRIAAMKRGRVHIGKA